MIRYNPKKIERKWQKNWETKSLYKAKDFAKKKKFYILVEFPYPSGEGLHVGHARSYSALDAVARKKRMEGYNVLYPMGWDAFGLPAENYAIKTGIHPSITVKENIANFKSQMKRMGLSFDWSREISTIDPAYYRWTQWIFLKLFEKGLAYQAKIPINWCPVDKIGLANEEVINGKCERCGSVVEQRQMQQWMLSITKYADRLIKDLEKVNYLEKIKAQQINWIGKSHGVEVSFKVADSSEVLKVFTTRLDTIFGVTAVVIAPEHPSLERIVKNLQKNEVERYLQQARQKSEFERTKLEKQKTGVFSGSYAINPANNEQIPIWIGDYVVASYGGGAVMVVPAHDRRDYDFAKKYGLEIREVIAGGDISKGPFVGEGMLVNSSQFTGLSSKGAIQQIGKWLEAKKIARNVVQYKLRDWIFSRQHYWGEPIPIIHCEKCGVVPVPEKDLPVKLPYVKNYKPTTTGESPLAQIQSWVNTKCPKCRGAARRETDTMPNWAGSSWYFMRYADPKNKKALADSRKLKYWMQVDWYNGGMEHTTLHLLYSRFWYKFLYDIGVAPQSEPYARRTSHGIVLAYDGRKMSKSFGNVVSPDEVVKEYGADTLRLYEMFMGPFDQAIAWSPQGIKGTYRFLNRFWELVLICAKNKKSSPEALRLLHALNKQIDEELEEAKFNTIVSSFMKFVNFGFERQKEIGKEAVERLLILFAPFAPYIGEELWHQVGKKTSVHAQPWPTYEKKFLKEEKVVLVIQINGRVRDQIEVDEGISQDQAEKIALAQPRIKNWTEGKKIQKTIFVRNKLLNIVL